MAGPNAGGTLILHANTSLVYTEESGGYCGESDLTSCDQAVTSVTGTEPVVFFAIAAFPGSSPYWARRTGVPGAAKRLVVIR